LGITLHYLQYVEASRQHGQQSWVARGAASDSPRHVPRGLVPIGAGYIKACDCRIPPTRNASRTRKAPTEVGANVHSPRCAPTAAVDRLSCRVGALRADAALNLGDVAFIPCKYAAVAVITRSAPSAGKHGFATVQSLMIRCFSYGQTNNRSVTFRAGTEILVAKKDQMHTRRSTPEALEAPWREPLRLGRVSRLRDSRDTQLPPARD